MDSPSEQEPGLTRGVLLALRQVASDEVQGAMRERRPAGAHHRPPTAARLLPSPGCAAPAARRPGRSHGGGKRPDPDPAHPPERGAPEVRAAGHVS
jgi:hypothetical protein